MLRNKPILLIENNSLDAENIKSIFDSWEMKYELFHAKTTQEALNYLFKKELPGLIILGLDSENHDIIEFIQDVKTNNNLRQIPIVIIASSNDRNDVLKSFELGAAGFILKPHEISELSETLNTIMQYWNLCELPPIGE